MSAGPRRRHRVLRTRTVGVLAVALALVASAVITSVQSTPAAAAPVLTGPFATRGAQIIDRSGREVVFKGVNWFGFETATELPHGLWVRDYVDMLRQIRSLGYDTVRLPFSVEAVRSTKIVAPSTSGGSNAGLVGKTPLQAMDVIIDEAGRQGLSILLDLHSLRNDGYTDALWYSDRYSEADWIATWQQLARRWRDRTNIIGADLKNEPHGEANWGEGGPADWHAAATRAGNAVVAENPNWLIVVEGTEKAPVGSAVPGNWWGGNLEGARAKPVVLTVPNRVVYSPHEYGPGVHLQPWFATADLQATMLQRWRAGWGYLVDENRAPVLIGEFGAKQVDTTSLEGRWFNALTDYLGAKRLSWTFWSWNPNSGDTGGVLQADWRSIESAKQDALLRLMSRTATPNPTTTTTRPTTTTTRPVTTRPVTTRPVTTTTRPVSTTTRLPTPSTTRPVTTTTRPVTTTSGVGVTATTTITTDWGSGYCAAVSVTNRTTATQTWAVSLAVAGRVYDAWNTRWSQATTTLLLAGVDWNRQLAPGATLTDVGFCASR